jgi:hypothetical protein
MEEEEEEEAEEDEKEEEEVHTVVSVLMTSGPDSVMSVQSW